MASDELLRAGWRPGALAAAAAAGAGRSAPTSSSASRGITRNRRGHQRRRNGRRRAAAARGSAAARRQRWRRPPRRLRAERVRRAGCSAARRRERARALVRAAARGLARRGRDLAGGRRGERRGGGAVREARVSASVRGPASAAGFCRSRWPLPAPPSRAARGARTTRAAPPAPPPPRRRPRRRAGSGWRRWRPTSACSASTLPSPRSASRRCSVRLAGRRSPAPRPLAPTVWLGDGGTPWVVAPAGRRCSGLGGGGRAGGLACARGRAAVGRRRRPTPSSTRRRRRCRCARSTRSPAVSRARPPRCAVGAWQLAIALAGVSTGLLQSAGRLALTALPPGLPATVLEGRRSPSPPPAWCTPSLSTPSTATATTASCGGLQSRVRTAPVRLALRRHRPRRSPRRRAASSTSGSARATAADAGVVAGGAREDIRGSQCSRYEPLRAHAPQLAAQTLACRGKAKDIGARNARVLSASGKRTPPKKKAAPPAATAAPIRSRAPRSRRRSLPRGVAPGGRGRRWQRTRRRARPSCSNSR